MKVITIVGTRPEIIKLSRVMAALDSIVDHVVVHSGQNFDFELNEIFFDELSIRRPNYFLGAAGKSAAETIARVIEKSDEVFEREKPDALLVLGDTNSCLSVISAKRRKIPIFHMESGNRGFDQRIPEEINRKIVDHISDVNMPYTEHARRNLIAENIPVDRIFKTGSPQKEILDFYEPLITKSKIHERLGLQPQEYFTASIHREENVDRPEQLELLVQSLNGAVQEFDMPMILSLHPRTRKRLDEFGSQLDTRINALAPLGFPDYIRLQKDSFCVLSDSGTITEESSILKFPAVTVREAHERPEGMDEGVLIMSGLEPQNVIAAIAATRQQFVAFGPSKTPPDYCVDNVSNKVVKIILSYTDYVNRRVWLSK